MDMKEPSFWFLGLVPFKDCYSDKTGEKKETAKNDHRNFQLEIIYKKERQGQGQ
jgi:hypothetical protein